MLGDITGLQLITCLRPTIIMRLLPDRMAAIHNDRSSRGIDATATAQPVRKPAHTLVLFSSDKELAALVRKIVKAPWKVELCEDPAIGREALARPSVRLVIVDDGAVDEEARGWLLDRIRKFVPQALLIYIASTHSEADERRARGYSAQYYTAKPLDTDRVARVIESFIRSASARDGGMGRG
jgi:DNA-binding NtrC family response regulator